MQTEYIYPAVADRTSPKEWVEIGRPDLVAKAIEKKNRILAEAAPSAIAPEIDLMIREKFQIYC